MIHIGLLAAMPEEISFLRKELAEYKVVSPRQNDDEREQYRINDTVLWVQEMGIGKVNAAYATTQMVAHLRPFAGEKLLMNVGVAGGSHLVKSIGDIVIGDKLFYHDVNATAFGYSYGQVPRQPEYFRTSQQKKMLVRIGQKCLTDSVQNVYLGDVATGDRFVEEVDDVKEIMGHFPRVLAIEMEAAAMAQVATKSRMDFAVIKAISDFPNSPENAMEYQEFVHFASEKMAAIIMQFLVEYRG